MYKSKYDKWCDNLSPQMQDYLQEQPVWHDKDIWRFGIVGFVLGLMFGLVI